MKQPQHLDDVDGEWMTSFEICAVGRALVWSSGSGGAELAPGTAATLTQLRRRQDIPREPVPDLPRGVSTFNLDETLFGRNVRSAKRGAAGGPSGMTCDHLRPLLDSPRDLHTLFLVAESFSRGLIPRSVVEIVKLGWMTALRKKDGGVRGIVAGEVIHRDCTNNSPTIRTRCGSCHCPIPVRIVHTCWL